MLLQGGLTVRHRAHNPKIGGSIPLPVFGNTLRIKITFLTTKINTIKAVFQY